VAKATGLIAVRGGHGRGGLFGDGGLALSAQLGGGSNPEGLILVGGSGVRRRLGQQPGARGDWPAAAGAVPLGARLPRVRPGRVQCAVRAATAACTGCAAGAYATPASASSSGVSRRVRRGRVQRAHHGLVGCTGLRLGRVRRRWPLPPRRPLCTACAAGRAGSPVGVPPVAPGALYTWGFAGAGPWNDTVAAAQLAPVGAAAASCCAAGPQPAAFGAVLAVAAAGYAYGAPRGCRAGRGGPHSHRVGAGHRWRRPTSMWSIFTAAAGAGRAFS
jgi:hypothetical protein